MLTPEWQLAHDKITLARQREQITHEQLQFCLGANTPVDAMRRLHHSQRTNASHTHQRLIAEYQAHPPIPKPPVMNPIAPAYPIIAAVLIWAGFHFTGTETHTIDGIIFAAAVAATAVILFRKPSQQ